ncbi:MAG: carbohydrate ABC transporter substrate-binding protein [Anaerolinea sp.]|nr:carbohydrate ABC transporter substrate-binding protein [Anaerolinea sp.]
MSIKKLVSVFFSIVLLCGLLAACATPATPTAAAPTAAPATEVAATAAPTDAPVKSDVTLTYLASQDWVFDAERDLGQKFEEQTGIHIDYQIVPSDQYFTLLKTKLNTGEGPDIFGGQSGVTDLILNYDVEKNAVDLSAEPWAKMEDPLVAAQATVNGKLYGLTYTDVLSNSWVINYNKAIFEQYNLSVPTNYAEFKTLCQTLLDNGIQPLYEPISDGWHQVLWFPELGPQYENVTPGLAEALNANTATFTGNETMLTALTQLNEIYTLGFMGENALSDTYADAQKAMASGKVAMVLYGTSFPQLVEAAYPEVKADTFGFFVMPLADNQLLNVNPAGPTEFIYSGGKHIEEAKMYFEFLTQPENLQYYVDTNPKALSLPFQGVKSEYTSELQAFFDAQKDTRGTVYQTAVNYVNPQWMDMGKDIVAMFTGTLTPEGMLKNIDQRRTDMATTAGDPGWK